MGRSLVFSLVSLASAWDGWTDCGTADDIATLNSVTVTPDPPRKGVPLTFSFDLDVKEQVSGGTIVLDLKAGDTIKIPVKETDDLCDQFKDFGGCPVAVGNLVFSIADETIPKLIPEKHIYGTIKLIRDDNKQIACINLDAIIKSNRTSTVV